MCVLIHSDDRVDLCLVVAAVTFILNCHLNRLFSVMQFPVILRALFLSLLSFVFVLPFHLISVCAEKRISIFDLLRHSTCYTGVCVCEFMFVFTIFIVLNKVPHNASARLWTIYFHFFFALLFLVRATVCIYAVCHLFGHYFANNFFLASCRMANVVLDRWMES